MHRADETDAEYKTRVTKWLMQISDHEFTQLSQLIDNEKSEEKLFSELYMNCMKKRAD